MDMLKILMDTPAKVWVTGQAINIISLRGQSTWNFVNETRNYENEEDMLIFYHLLQCCGSGFVWIRIDFGRLNPDPDPGVQK
jgi:hypothetical protein